MSFGSSYLPPLVATLTRGGAWFAARWETRRQIEGARRKQLVDRGREKYVAMVAALSELLYEGGNSAWTEYRKAKADFTMLADPDLVAQLEAWQRGLLEYQAASPACDEDGIPLPPYEGADPYPEFEQRRTAIRAELDSYGIEDKRLEGSLG